MTQTGVVLDLAGDQIDGARDYQEDAFLITAVGPATALIAMADGVGGAAAGNIASQLVTNTFNRQFTSRIGSEPVPAILRDALNKGNESLGKSIEETPGLAGMGCTCVVGAIVDGKLWWVSVGDSHLYLLRGGELIKKNADHSYGAYLDMMEAAGTPVEPDPSFRRNMLMSALSGEAITMIDCPDEPTELLAGDRVVICSDGLDTLDAATIIAVSARSATPKECVANLLQAVTDAAKPRQDNTTVIVCDVTASTPAPEPAPEPEPQPEPKPLSRYDLEALREAEEARATRRRRVIGIGALLLVVVALAWAADHFEVLSHVRALAERPAPTEVESVAAVESTPAEEPAAPELEPDPEAVHAPAPEQPPFRDRLRSGGSGPQMVLLPAGSFMMGVRGSLDPAETPYHRVEMPAFAVGTHEVTFAEYDRFARATRRTVPQSQALDRATHPVFGVSWHDAVAYAEWLSRETGERYTLPSESQWEYAASAGSTGPYWWGYEPPQGRAHCFGCTPGAPARLPTAVGRFEPNRFGVYDTVGNVAEWVRDCFHPNYRGAPADGTVREGGDCSVRVVRGGHFASPQPTSQKRDRFPPDRGSIDIGFRVVREP